MLFINFRHPPNFFMWYYDQPSKASNDLHGAIRREKRMSTEFVLLDVYNSGTCQYDPFGVVEIIDAKSADLKKHDVISVVNVMDAREYRVVVDDVPTIPSRPPNMSGDSSDVAWAQHLKGRIITEL